MTDLTGSWESRPTGWTAVEDSSLGHQPEVDPESRVLGVGASCELVATSDGDSQSFAVAEFLTLTGGVRFTVATGRGFTISWNSGQDGRDGAPTEAEILTLVLNTVLPDDDDPTEPHRWDELAAAARDRGVQVTASHLRTLDYQVLLSPGVQELLGPGVD